MATEEELKRDEFFMRKALIEAQAAFDEGEIPIGAVVVCKGQVISRAHNLTERLHDETAHEQKHSEYGTCRDARHYSRYQPIRREISHRLHLICYH